MTVITADERQSPKGAADEATLFKSMMAYVGKFRLEKNDLLVIRAEVAWHPDWVDTEQARYFKLNGKELLILSNQTTHPKFPGRMGRGVVVWHQADLDYA